MKNIFDHLIPEDAAKKLAEEFLKGTADDSITRGLLRPSYSNAAPIRFHEYNTYHVDDVPAPTHPRAADITTYTVQLDHEVSGHGLQILKHEIERVGIDNMAADYLWRKTNDDMARRYYNDPASIPSLDYGFDYIARMQFDNRLRMAYGYDDDTDRRHGEAYGFKDYTGKTLKTDPRDKHLSGTNDPMERSEYNGNLYAYKILILNALGKPRSYYKSAAGVWNAGWRDAECINSSLRVAELIHEGSSDPLPSACECGFHTWYELPPDWESPRKTALTSVPVVVQIGGDVLYAARGARVQHARVRAVIDCGNDGDTRVPRIAGKVYPTREELGLHFDVPVIRSEDVELWASVEGLRPAVSRMQELMREDV